MTNSSKPPKDKFNEISQITCPFPATAVATLSQNANEFWSLETQAIKQAKGLLNNYLQRDSEEQKNDSLKEQGLILAIVGDYGTGKTHIAQDMLKQIYAQYNLNLHPIYLDAPSDNFLALYRDRFMKKLDRREVLQRIEEYYADIVAEELEKTNLTQSVAIALRGRKLSADDIVNEFGLMESTFIRTLSQKLKNVTKQADFGTALLLLRRIEFQAAVWEWLNGASPDIVLQERGINHQIDTDAKALEAIGVMAFLFGQQKHRFILFIDEIEKVLSHVTPQRPEESTILALKKLMEAMSTTRAMLVLIGLPEFQEFLPEDARQRITATIHPSPVTKEEIVEYIREAQRRKNDIDSLDPFTMDTIDYLQEITGGNVRKMVRLCYHAYLAAVETQSHVNRAMLREIAREQFEATSTEDITIEITRYIESHGWLFEKEKTTGTPKNALRVDYWLPIGEDGTGIIILISRSILQSEDAKKIIQSIAQLSNKKKVEKILIVNGYLADNLRQELEKTFGRILVYRLRSFREDLDSILVGARTRLEQLDKENVLAAIKQRVDEIARQNQNIGEQLSRSVTHGELQLSVSAGLRSVFGQLAEKTSISEANYPNIAEVFIRFDRILEDFSFNFFPIEPNTFDPYSLFKRIEAIFNDYDKYISRYYSQLYFVKEFCKFIRQEIFFYLENRDINKFRSADLDEGIIDYCKAFDRFSEYFQENSFFGDEIILKNKIEKSNFERNFARKDFDVFLNELRRMGGNIYNAAKRDLRS